jgi:hypothetical protein
MDSDGCFPVLTSGREILEKTQSADSVERVDLILIEIQRADFREELRIERSEFIAA